MYNSVIMTQETRKKPNVKDLPAHAQLECVKEKWYVYYAYNFSINGKHGQERDYIGTVDPKTHEFVPNAFYMREHPVFEHRNPDRWKNPVMRQRELQKLKELAGDYSANDLDEEGDYSYQVGATALAMAILEQDGMPFDIGTVVFPGNLKKTMDFLNLAIHAAITADPTYLAKSESDAQKYIGTGCLNSRRASEFLTQLGSDTDAPYRLARARVERLDPEEALALDATRFDSESEKISITEIGKRKDDTFGAQVSFSMLIGAKDGKALCYRLHGGNFPDVSTIDGFIPFWSEIGIEVKNPTFVFDRGYASARNVIELDANGFLYLMGVRNSLSAVRKTVEQRNSDYYQIESVLPGHWVYGVQSKAVFTHEGKSLELSLFTYRNPQEETRCAMETLKSLQKFEEAWSHGFYDTDSPLASFYTDPTPGKPLKRDTYKIENAKLTDGFFAFASNVKGLDTLKAFEMYKTRNEVEVLFRLIFHYLLHSTRVHSLQALRGLAMVTFVAIGVITVLKVRMNNPMLPKTESNPGTRVKDEYTIGEVFKKLSHIELEKRAGSCKLLNLTQDDKYLVESLGFKDLFLDARTVDHLLSASYLAQILKA